MLHEARAARTAPAPARLMLALGVLATVAANVAFGARFARVRATAARQAVLSASNGHVPG